MSTPHKHAAVIKAWADGAQIQFSSDEFGWTDLKSPEWFENVVYRVKPDPFAEFKAALARGERVDARAKGQAPGVGWFELPPLFSIGSAPAHEFRIALPWQDERDAYDRGETIQLERSPGRWVDCLQKPWWEPGNKYRVKPKTVSHVCEVVTIALVAPGSLASYSAAPFKLPRIRLDIESTDGIVTNVTLKDWHK